MANKFRSAYSGHERKYSNAGSEYKKEYGYEINTKGRKVLVETGKKNLYEEIQASHEETKIENVLRRVAAGDMSDFRPTGIYTDISEIPNNLIEAKRQITQLENMWHKLDANTKKKYNNSVEEFVAAAGEKAWLVDMGYIKDEPMNAGVDETTVTSKELETTTTAE